MRQRAITLSLAVAVVLLAAVVIFLVIRMSAESDLSAKRADVLLAMAGRALESDKNWEVEKHKSGKIGTAQDLSLTLFLLADERRLELNRLTQQAFEGLCRVADVAEVNKAILESAEPELQVAKVAVTRLIGKKDAIVDEAVRRRLRVGDQTQCVILKR